MGDWFEKVTIGEMLDRAVGRFGTREALTYAGRHWSWQALQEACDRAAQGLIHCGIQAGEHIALWLTNRPEWLHILFAAAKIGAVLVPINTRFRSMDLEYVLRQSESTTLITTDHSGPIGYLDMVRQVIPELDTCTTPQTRHRHGQYWPGSQHSIPVRPRKPSAAPYFLPCDGSSSSASRRTRARCAGRTCSPPGRPCRLHNVAHGSTRWILTRRR